jgi:hypothetical protein
MGEVSVEERREMAYREVFEPIAQVDQNLYVFAPSRPKIHGYYRVLFVEPTLEIVHDFGALAAQGDTGDVEVTELYMDDDNCANYRIYPLDDVVVGAKQPKALQRWTTKEASGYLDQMHGQVAGKDHRHMTEVFVWEDEKLFFVVANPLYYPAKKSRVLFQGYRYSVEKLKEKPRQYAFFPVEGAKGSLVTGQPAATALSPTLPATIGRRVA